MVKPTSKWVSLLNMQRDKKKITNMQLKNNSK